MPSFAQRFAQLISERGWTQLDAAEKLGVSQALISRYLSGKRKPLPRTIAHIAARLGVDSDELTGEKEVRSSKAGPDQPPSGKADPRLSYVVAMKNLKAWWKRQPRDRGTIKHLVAALFRDDAARILDWLDE
jgi:transcriptional regulator with XRE-family HTH domain